MILQEMQMLNSSVSVPRVGGGDPGEHNLETLECKCSPRRRG